MVIFSIIKISLFCSFSGLLPPAQSPFQTECVCPCPARRQGMRSNQNGNETLTESPGAYSSGPPPTPNVAGSSRSPGERHMHPSEMRLQLNAPWKQPLGRLGSPGFGIQALLMILALLLCSPVLPGRVRASLSAGAGSASTVHGASPPRWGQGPLDTEPHVSDGGCGPHQGGSMLQGPQEDPGPHRLCHLSGATWGQ